MKTVFVVNPKSGQGKNVDKFLENIEKTIKDTGADAEIYITKGIGDAKIFAEKYCAENGAARFIACGGDGTLSEVLNGAINCKETEIGVIPMGTGNDFCRNFDASLDFSDIKKQISGECQKCDAIHYKTEFDGKITEGYCVNMVNIGFDCNVADMTAQMKKKPLISGSMAYFISILVAMIKKKGANLLIEIDGEVVHCGKLLLNSLANGSFCGGGN